MRTQPRLLQQRILGNNMDSTLFIVIRRIHRLLWMKHHRHSPKPPKSSIKSCTIRLISHVRENVHESTPESPPNLSIDWESRVFGPTIATLYLTDVVHICEADAQYKLLLSTLLALAFEEYFVEPDIWVVVENMLRIEQKRLAKAGVNVKVLRATQCVRGLLPDIELCAAAWKMQLTSHKPRPRLEAVVYADGKDCISRPLASRRRMRGMATKESTDTHSPTS